ncbi:DMT family transporter [Dongia rigui]|uniref:DMT family transporter n=1 Tax=Dongia rigui TaxID=940149 RepID=A0ABU5DVN8_9PROT|nr:DMT family transporter [Dongia rigui]MDY0871375.1 DMT family transporter [Dongia rigui]
MPAAQRLLALRLLLSTGILLGLNAPLGKLGRESGISAAGWSFAIAAGGALVLLAVILLRRQPVHLNRRHLRYYVGTALLSYVIPNLVIYAAIPHLGAGMAAIYFTLSPIMTLTFSIVLGTKRPGALGVFGILLGCVGALIVVFSKGQVGRPADLAWALGALVIPLSLAAGNIYRTVDWPEGGAPLVLAMGSNAAAALFLIAAALLFDGGLPFAALANAPGLVVAQIAIAALMFALFFRLQVAGGPVYLSQIGYVAAGTALIIGTFFLGEHYGIATWGGALVIVAGVVATTLDGGPKTQR